MERLVANLVGGVRSGKLNGRDYLIAPLTMIVPGVLPGSQGPLYYPPDELAKNVQAWNGIPITVNHPSLNGTPVSARRYEVLESQGIGLVLESRINPKGNLIAEGWFDIEKTRKVDNRIIDALLSGKRLELSTGLYTENEEVKSGATYNGRAYTHVARNYQPDHLAILPDQKGACSLADGCGVLVNVLVDGEVVAGCLPLDGVVLAFNQDGYTHKNETIISLSKINELLS